MKILCVGMNYAKHNKELDGALYKPEEPVIFTKPDSALLKGGKPFFVPDFTQRCEYEVEIVARICRLGKNIAPRFAPRYYDALTAGIDMTARDMQQRFRQKGLPWDLCKGFDGSAVIGDFVAKEELGDINSLSFRLDIDGKTAQCGFSGDMLYKIDELIAYVSRFFTLKTGDLLFTGTPEGVGPVKIGQRLEGYLGERKVLELKIK